MTQNETDPVEGREAQEAREDKDDEQRRLRLDDDAPFWVATHAYWKRMIEDALRATGGRVDRAANALGISKSWLFKLMRKLGVDRKACREEGKPNGRHS